MKVLIFFGITILALACSNGELETSSTRSDATNGNSIAPEAALLGTGGQGIEEELPPAEPEGSGMCYGRPGLDPTEILVSCSGIMCGEFNPKTESCTIEGDICTEGVQLGETKYVVVPRVTDECNSGAGLEIMAKGYCCPAEDPGPPDISIE